MGQETLTGESQRTQHRKAMVWANTQEAMLILVSVKDRTPSTAQYTAQNTGAASLFWMKLGKSSFGRVWFIEDTST